MDMDGGDDDDIQEDFLYAARTGDQEWLVELLASHPQLVNSADTNGNTPLHLSSANGHNEIIKILLKYPQSISPQNSAGNTPLHWACLNNHVDTAKLLVQEGADMFLKNNAGKDAVWEAQQRGNEDLVGWLLGFGVEEAIVGEVIEEDVADSESAGEGKEDGEEQRGAE